MAHRSREAVLLAALVGVATGFGVAFMEWLSIDVMLRHVLALPAWLRPAMPLAGLVVTSLLLHRGGRLTSDTADAYISNFHQDDDLPARPVPWRIAGAVATIGSGAPGGLEGASIYLGSSIGTAVQRRFRSVLGPGGTKNLMVAGAAAGVAAIFKAPATGAVFALEVPYRDDLGRHLLIPSLVGAASGYLAFVTVTDTHTLLDVRGAAPFDVRDLLGAVVLGAVCGVVIRGYARLIRAAKQFRKRQPVWVSVAVAGACIAGLAVATRAASGEPLAYGVGYDAIRWAADPSHSLPAVGLLLVVRMLGPAATLAGGGLSGLFLPLVVTGALLGRLAAGLTHAPNPSLFVILGVAAALGAGYRVPLAAVMFVAEATGRPGFVVPGLLAAVGADLLMGNSSVTAYQRSGSDVDEEH